MSTSTKAKTFECVEFFDPNPAIATACPHVPPGLQELVDYLVAGDVVGTAAKALELMQLEVRKTKPKLRIDLIEFVGWERFHLCQGKHSIVIVKYRRAEFPAVACRFCGCTNDLGCAGGCSWATADVCSRCDRNRKAAH